MAKYGVQWDSNANSGVGKIQWIKMQTTKYLICDKNNILWNYNTSVLNKLNDTLAEETFINKGMDDYMGINNQMPTQKGVYALDKGVLGSGKYFEFNLDNSFNSITNIE